MGFFGAEDVLGVGEEAVVGLVEGEGGGGGWCVRNVDVDGRRSLGKAI